MKKLFTSLLRSLLIFLCGATTAFSQTLCVDTGSPVGGSGGVATSSFAQSLTMGAGCSGVFAGLVVDAASVANAGGAVWTLEIFQGDGFGGTLLYTQTGITLTDIGGGHIFINIAGGSGSRAFTGGSQYTFRVSNSTSNTVTVFRNETSFYAGGQGYTNNSPFGTGGDILDVAIFVESVAPPSCVATRLYVKHNASGANNGTSWTNAYTSLQSAIDYARGCSNIQEIWVASGTYKPSKDKTGNASPITVTNRTFYVDFPVAIYGGFAGGENALSARNVSSNVTVLSGDIDNNDGASPAVVSTDVQGSNAKIVVHIQNVANGVTVDGFTVGAGADNGIFNEGTGYPFGSSATIRNCKIQGNTGSAILNRGNLASSSAGKATLLVENSSISGNTDNFEAPGIDCNSNGGMTSTTVNNCTFSNNTSTGSSFIGAYHEHAPSGHGTASFSNCVFSDNTSSTANGAAVHANGSSVGTINHTFTNCVFRNNTSAGKGGAYYANGASSGRITTVFTNCTFYDNEATNGGGAIAYTTSVSHTSMLLRNCILWQNPNEILLEGSALMTLSYSLINSTSAPSGVISTVGTLFNTDPLFVNAAGGNLRLQNCSPARNSGTSSGAPSTDLDNNARPALGGYDMGAYEAQTGSAPTTYYADADGDGSGNAAVSQQACSQPTGYVTDNTDCDDTDPLEKPNQIWYKDTDNDGYAQTGAATMTQCLRPTGYKVATELLATSGDCNDNNAAIKPGATEVCDGVDNNCNGSTDEGGICSPDYTISTTGGVITITDLAGNGETLNISESGANIRFATVPATRTYSLNGGATTAFSTPANVALSGVSSIVVNTDVGNDIINVGGFNATNLLPSLTINGGVGDDEVNFNGDITFVNNANLDVDLQNDNVNPGTDQVSFTNSANLVLSGAGAAVLKASRNIAFSNGTASLETTNGNLTLEANQQATASTGNFVGVSVNGATVRVNGTGTLSVKGKSGNDASIPQYGVVVQNGGLISGGTSATATVEGSAGAASANGNIGVYVAGTNARIASLGGNVSVIGLNNSAGASSTCRGVAVGTNGTISAGGSGNVSVTGTGGAGSGNFNAGVYVAGNTSTMITSSGGNVTVTGTGGGSGSGNNNYGVWQELGGTITAGGSGSVTVNGTGGNTTGGDNYGVYVSSGLAQITSSGGAISVTGQGGGGTSTGEDNIGVFVDSNGLIAASSGSGSVTVNGTGANTSGNRNYGVYVSGSGARIRSFNGNLNITAQGGGSGTSQSNMGLAILSSAQVSSTGSGHVIIQANGSAGATGHSNYGLYVEGASSLITSSGGNVTINATGGGAAPSSYGASIAFGGQISAGGTGTVTIIGQGGGGSGGNNYGVQTFASSSQITSGGGDITITGIEGAGSNSFGIYHFSPAAITTATNGGNITLIANSMNFAGTVSTQVPGGSTTLRPYTNNVAINLGTATNTTGGPLGLSDTELDQITTGTLVIGHANSGNINVSDAITRPTSTNVQLISGGDVLISNGGFDTGGGTMLLDPGTSPAAVKPTFNGTDVTASTLSFVGDLSIAMNGTTLGNGTGSTYTQLKVTGAVNLSGVNLLLTGSYVPTGGETFTILDNDGAENIVGTFTGLLEGATIPNFRGSGLNATISYVGGSGNDVVITVALPCPTTAAAGLDQTPACGTTQVTLAANTLTVGTGLWSVVSGTGGAFGNASSPTSSFTGTAGSVYELRWTTTNGSCTSSDEMSVSFGQNPTAAAAGSDQTPACGTTQVTLAGNTLTVGTGLWTVVSGTGGTFGNASSPTSSFTGTAGSVYGLRWTTTNGACTSSDEMSVTFGQNPTAAAAGSDQAPACGTTQVTLTGNTLTVGTGLWTVVSGTGGTFGNASSPTSSFTGTAGSVYGLRWTTTNGACTSSDEMSVTFGQNPTAAAAGSDQAPACGTTQVTLTGNTLTVGTGLWTVVSGTGGVFGNASSPTSSFTGTAGSVYVLRWTTSNGSCTSSDEMSVTFGQNPTAAAAGSDQTPACGTTQVTLAGNTLTVGTGLWTVVSGTGGVFGDASSPTSSFTGTAGSVYVLRWTTTNGSCTSSDEMSVSFGQNPTAAAAGSDQAPACGTTQVTLTGNTLTVGTGLWTVVSGTGGVFGNASSPTSSFTGTAGSVYVLRWTTSNGSCTSSDEMSVTFGQNPTAAAAGSDQTPACGTTQVTLAGNTPTVGTGLWTVVSGTGGTFGNASSPTSSFTGTAGSVYELRWTTTNGSCTSSDEMSVSLGQNPTVAAAGSDQAPACGTTQVTLAGNTPTVGTGLWSVVSGTGGTFGNASSPTSSFTGTAGSVYELRWTTTNGSCTSSDEMSVSLGQNPTVAAAGSDQAPACGTTQVTLAGNTPTVGTGLWSVVSGTGGTFGNASSPTSSFTGTAGSVYVLRWTTTNGSCTSSDEMSVTFGQNPTAADAGSDQTPACGTTQVTLAGNTPTVGTGLWTVVSGTGGTFGDASSPTSSFTGTAGSVYELRWTTTNGSCTSSDEISVTFRQNPTVACPSNIIVADNDQAFALSGATPIGGVYSGPGVNGGIFNPASANIGLNTIQYSYNTAAGCTASCSFTITVCATQVWYLDADNDGFGNASVSQQACSQPTGYVSNNTDCDDSDALEKPGQVWYADLDNDGYSSGATLTQCLRPTNYKAASELTSTTGDCNDNNAAIINSLSATISYAGTPFCKTLTSAVVTLTGSSGGTFSSTSGLSIDGATGAINPSTSTAGTYTVTYSIASSGGCAGVNATTVVAIQGKPTITLNTLQQTLNEGNNPVLCDTDANPVNSLQFNVSGLCVSGSPVWRVQVGNGAWSAWSATAPVSQSSNNQPHRYQAACDASCASTYSGVIELTINNRATVPQNVSLVVDGVTVAVGETKEVCSLITIPLTFNANCAAGEIVLYSVDGGEYSSGVPTGLVDNQYHNYRVRCRKSDGTPSCVESESGVMRLKLVTIPTAPTVSLSSTSSCDATASFSGQSTCGSLRTVWYNAATNVALPSLPSTVPSQTMSYYARCQTENGCVSEKSNVVTFTLTPTQVAPVITASQEIVCTGTTVTISANCPAGSQTFWNTGVTVSSFQVAFNNVTKQTYWAKCIFEGGCQSSESVRKDIYWNAFVVTLINVGETKSAVKPANDKSLWSSQFITRDGGPELEQSTQQNPTLYYVENANKMAPRYWTINVEACGLSTDGSLTFDMLATPEMGVIRSFNTHENNAPYFMYANREGWTELYAQNHPAYGFYQDNGAGGNVYDAGLPKGLYKLGIRYWDMKGWGSIYPSTRQPQGNVLAYQEYWFRIQSKDGVGVGAARTADSGEQGASNSALVPPSGRSAARARGLAVLPNPVTNILRLQVQDSKGQAVQTTLTDASGREVLRRQFVPETNIHQEEFGVSELPAGMYFLKVSTSEKQTTLKVVKVGQ